YESPISGSFQASRLQIKIIPFINVLWAGCILLHFAIIPLVIGRFIMLKQSLSPEQTPPSGKSVTTSHIKEVPISEEI
ncbi:MAG: hypothetical protein ACXACU_17360, partial [Candidatus Hodarchaeales archaeon]